MQQRPRRQRRLIDPSQPADQRQQPPNHSADSSHRGGGSRGAACPLRARPGERRGALAVTHGRDCLAREQPGRWSRRDLRRPPKQSPSLAATAVSRACVSLGRSGACRIPWKGDKFTVPVRRHNQRGCDLLRNVRCCHRPSFAWACHRPARDRCCRHRADGGTATPA